MSKSLDSHSMTTIAASHPQPLRSGRRGFVRLLWKELLALRAFAGMLAAVVALTSGLLWLSQPLVSEEITLLLLSLPQLIGVIFGIGCGTLLFAQEDEAGTLDFLRGMGVSPRSLVNAKLAAGFASLVVLVGVTTLVRWQPALADELTSGSVSTAVLSCSVGLVMLLWTSLWSMALRRELLAVCCGLFGALLLKPFVEQWEGTGLLILSAVLASGLWLLCQVAASRWMGTGGWWWRTNSGATESADSQSLVSDVKSLTNVIREWGAIPIVAGGLIAAGVALLLLLMMWWPQSARAGTWPENLEMMCTLLLAGVLGWLPVRSERRKTLPTTTTSVRDWQRTLANASMTWLLLWWLLSFGLLTAYDSNSSLASFPAIPPFLHKEVLPWSLLAFCSGRLMARLCAGRWVTWPLFVLALSVSWCVWWLLARLGESAPSGLVLLAALFSGASVWHWWLIQRGASVRRANFCTGIGVIFSIGFSWGLLNWWRVAEIPTDWTGGQQPTALEPLPLPDDGQLAELQAEWLKMASLIQPAPVIPWSDGRLFDCYQSDWGLMEGRRDWNQVSEPSEAWVEANGPAIQSLLRLSQPNRRRLLRQWLFAEIVQTEDSPFRSSRSRPQSLPKFLSYRAVALCLLAAKRCEAAGQLDDAGRLLEFSNVLYGLFEKDSRSRDDYGDLLLRSDRAERLAVWISQPDQTSARLKQSIHEWLQDLDELPPPEILLNERFQTLRAAHSGILHSDYNERGTWSWERKLFRLLCPAEEFRERRILDGLEQAHRVSFTELRPLPHDLSTFWKSHFAAETLSPPMTAATLSPIRSRLNGLVSNMPPVRGPAADLIARTPRLESSPQSPTSFGGRQPILTFLAHVNSQRALLTLAAMRAFELDHQRPPTASVELVPAYLLQRPVCVFTGEDLLERSRPPGTLETSPNNPSAIKDSPTVAIWYRIRFSRIGLSGEPRPFIPFDGPPQL